MAKRRNKLYEENIRLRNDCATLDHALRQKGQDVDALKNHLGFVERKLAALRVSTSNTHGVLTVFEHQLHRMAEEARASIMAQLALEGMEQRATMIRAGLGMAIQDSH